MADTKIEWATKVWNPVRGCSLVSKGCRYCYAMRQAHRFSGPGKPYEGLTEIGPNGPRWNGKVRLVPELLEEPLRWRKPRRVFVNSMSDLFHKEVPYGFIRGVIQSALLAVKKRGHTFIFITKRAGRMLDYFQAEAHSVFQGYLAHEPRMQFGVSVEDQPTADDRVPRLLRCPVATLIVSYEPALRPVEFTSGRDWLRVVRVLSPDTEQLPHYVRPRIDWVIAGGESGPGERPPVPEWFRSARDQCLAAGVPFFFKQWGEWSPIGDASKHKYRDMPCGDGTHHRMFRVGKKAAGRLLDGREWNEYPKIGNRE